MIITDCKIIKFDDKNLNPFFNIYDIIYNKDKIIVIGNNNYNEIIDYDNIIITSDDCRLVKIKNTVVNNGDGFFIIEYKVDDLNDSNNDEIMINFSYKNVKEKITLKNYYNILKNLNLDKCVSTLFKDDYNQLYYWYFYYKKLGINTFILYYNGNLDKLDNKMIQFINRDDIILFQWNHCYSYSIEYDDINDKMKPFFQKGINNRIANAQLQSLNHCLFLLKPYCNHLLICDLDEFLRVKNMNDIIIEMKDLPGLLFNNIFSKIDGDKLIYYDHKQYNNHKYIVNPSKIVQLYVHGFLQNEISFDKLFNNNFNFSHIINYRKDRLSSVERKDDYLNGNILRIEDLDI